MTKVNRFAWTCFILATFLIGAVAGPGSQASAKDGNIVVIGKTVRNAQGVVIGKVENIVLNEQGCVEYVILSGKFSGARGRYYPMPWTVVRPAEDPQYILVDIDVAILREAPAISDVRHINVSQWGPKVHDFYVVRHKVGTRSGAKEPRAKEDAEDKAKASQEKKERTSPTGKPAIDKQIEKPGMKKGPGAKEESESVERHMMNKEKNLQLKEREDAIHRLPGQEKGVQQRLEGAVEEKKSGIKPETGSPALPSGMKKGGLPE